MMLKIIKTKRKQNLANGDDMLLQKVCIKSQKIMVKQHRRPQKTHRNMSEVGYEHEISVLQ